MLADVAVLKDYGINDLSADDAPPSEEILCIPVKLLIGHNPAAFVAFHSVDLLQQSYFFLASSVPSDKKCNNIKYLVFL
jgi:hypothetical protein